MTILIYNDNNINNINNDKLSQLVSVETDLSKIKIWNILLIKNLNSTRDPDLSEVGVGGTRGLGTSMVGKASGSPGSASVTRIRTN